jgi:RNA polymerase sigma-70 factor (ECF subfamily)
MTVELSDAGVLQDNVALEKATGGDRDAFGVLYERYVGRIYNYIYYRTGNPYDAEDLTARVFFRAMRRISCYEDRGVPMSAWLYRIAHNLVANWHRDRGRRAEIPLEDGASYSSSQEHPEAELLKTEERERLLAVIRKLPPDRQQLLILKFVEHLSNAEIGVIMGRTEGAVKSLYHRTLLSLRDELQPFVSISGEADEEIEAEYHDLSIESNVMKENSERK